jgi:hypothetical protein
VDSGPLGQHPNDSIRGTAPGPRHEAAPRRSAGEKGTAPVGGTTGAVDAPCSGGEEQVRRSALPLRGTNTNIVDHQAFNRNSSRQLRRVGSQAFLRSTVPTPSNVTKHPPPARRWHPAVRGAINRDPSRVTRRASCSCRTGTSPSRSVHQWTARAWVPEWDHGGRRTRVRRRHFRCTPARSQSEPLTFPPLRASAGPRGVSRGLPTGTQRRYGDGRTAPTSSGPRAPRRRPAHPAPRRRRGRRRSAPATGPPLRATPCHTPPARRGRRVRPAQHARPR